MEQRMDEQLSTTEHDKYANISESNWYVFFVQTGKEDEIANGCRKKIDGELLKKVFVPKYQTMIQIHSIWKKRESVLFPGYVFVETEDIVSLFMEMKKLPYSNVLLGKDGEQVHAISIAEKVRLQQFLNENDVIETSFGYKERDKIEITRGPLAGHEGEIKKINRHKRMASIEIEIFGRMVRLELGLELLNTKMA